jgi:hypothetical protein
MEEHWPYILVLTPLAATVLALAIKFNRAVPPARAFVRERVSSEQTWSDLYRDDTLNVASSVLDSLCDAFLFKRSDKWRLWPSDRLRDIYEAQYPPALGLADTLEHVFLVDDLGRRFDVPEEALFALWKKDPSIQDLVETCASHAGNAAPSPGGDGCRRV